MRKNRTSLHRPAFFLGFSVFSSRSRVRVIAIATALLVPAFFCGNAHAAATTYTVNTTTDTGTGSGTTGDLRYALTQAETAGNAGSTINITATGTITLTSNLPAITQDTTITGPGAGSVTISGAGQYAVFQITSTTATVAISGVTIAHGVAVNNSGGILNDGTLTVSNTTLLSNSASGTSGEGGGITNFKSLTVTNSTFVGNSASVGGGIFNGQNNTLTVLNSTFWGNAQSAINNYGTNTAASLTVVNSILTGDTGTECIGNGCPTNGSNGNVVAVTAAQANLLPLGNYGGTTLTILPMPGSVAICAGTASPPSPLTLPTTDQRGFALNAANCSNGGVDAGAVQSNYLMVTAATDSNDGSCTSTTCSLRDAITAANTAGGDIGFNSSLKGSTITLASALPAITGAVNLVGLGADQLGLSGGSSSTVGTVVVVNTGAQVSIYGLTITGGKSTVGSGGGISNSGTLSLLLSAVSGNTALSAAGIWNQGALTVTASTISGNTASSTHGGGLWTSSSGANFIVDSTIAGNTSTSGNGGGIYDTGGTLSIINSTISGNKAPAGNGGGISTTGTIDVANSIIVGNTATTNADVDGAYTDNGGNLVGTSGTNLETLGSYGGSTQTMLPLPGSTALCAGSSSLALDANGLALPADQRGFALGAASYCASGKIDAGAVQTDYTSAQFTNDTGYSALINQAVTPAPILSVTENGQNTGGIPITLTFTGTGVATGLGPVSTVAGTGATFSNIKVDTAGASDTLSVSLPVGSSSLTASANLEIDGLVTLSPASGALTGGSVGTSYSKSISASGGKGNGYTYTVASGALPDGLTLGSSTGLVSGTPTKAGSFSFSIQAADNKGDTGSASYTLAIAQAATSITVTSKDTTNTSEPSGASFVGDSVTFTASLAPVGKGVTFANGVAFTLDGTAVAACSSQTVTVATDGSTATATCVIANLAKGSHTIVASYPTGDSNYAAATSANFSQTVSLSVTSVIVSSNNNPSTVDSPVTLKATITNTSGSSVPSGGTVAFTSDGVSISGCSSVALVAGTSSATASCNTSSLTAASSPAHSIVATYSGDTTTFASSASAAFSQAVSKADTAVTVTSSGATGVNQQATFTASVTPTSPVALSSSGTVSFTDNGTAISGCTAVTITAATGQATCSATFTSATSQVISAVYNGDSNYNATAAGRVTTVTQSVTKATTSVALASFNNTTSVSGTSSSLNDSVTFTATITPYNGTTALTPPFTGAATVTGTVSFTSNGKSICSTSVGVDGAGNYSAACTTSTLPAGSDNIVATYNGNSAYSGSNNSLSQSVATVATTTAVTSSSGTSTVNQTVTFTASVTPFNAATALSGSVTFTATNTATSATSTLCNAVPVQPSTGVATCAASALIPGTYTVAANYGSDSNYNASSGSVPQSVGQATTSISLTASPNPSTINQQITLSATVTAPAGANALNGSVTFTDNGAPIADCPATTINPNNPTVTCKTSSLVLGANSLVASYGSDANFSNSSSAAVSQTVNAAPTSTSITSSAGTTTVDQSVSFTAMVSGASGTVQFSGAMSFTDNGTAIPGCSSISVGATTGTAVCTTSTLASGTHIIAANYSGDNNFSISGNSLTQKVNPGTSSTTLVSSLNPSIALNPNNYQDTVTLTATVSPSAGVPLSGAVTFTDNGAPIAECQSAIAVNSATGAASCITASLLSGSHTILAVYNGDPNFNSSSGTATQSVQDYTLAASPTSTVTVSQRFTNITDLFSPQPITVAATPIAGFTGNLSLTCSVTPLSAPSGAVPPACNLASSSMSIAAGQQQPVAVTIDAGTGATPVATAGTYNVSITGVDQTTGLTHATASFVVNVRYQAPPLTIVSGATSGNTTTVGFSLPANVGLTDILCASVTGPTLTSSVAPVALSMGCTFSPSTVPPTSTGQDVVITVAVSTGAANSARLDNISTAVTLAGLFAVPILAFLGFMPGPKSRKVFFRYLGIVIAAALLFTGTGCGGGSFTAPPSVSGQTPPGSYNILVQGTGTDHQTYQAVIQVNVTR